MICLLAQFCGQPPSGGMKTRSASPGGGCREELVRKRRAQLDLRGQLEIFGRQHVERLLVPLDDVARGVPARLPDLQRVGFGVGTAVEAEAVVLAVVVLVVVALAVVAFDVLATADAALAAVDVDAADVLSALDADVVAAVIVAADAVVVGAVEVAVNAVVGAAEDSDDLDTVADAPQAARPIAARTSRLRSRLCAV